MNSSEWMKSAISKGLSRVIISVFGVLVLAAYSCTNEEMLQMEAMEVLAEGSLAGPGQGVHLNAVNGAVIDFKPHNGRNSEQVWSLPHLVLFRNGELSDASERTLMVAISDLVVPPAGLMVDLTIETQNGDPDLGGSPNKRMEVWQGSQVLLNDTGVTQTGINADFYVVFGETTSSGDTTYVTPTGYYRCEIIVTQLTEDGVDRAQRIDQDYAFLMERQVLLPLSGGNDGPGPDELVVYFSDTMPFQRISRDAATRLQRVDVPAFVQNELAPAMVRAESTQTDEWGFSWEDGWNIYSRGESDDRLSVALTDGDTWFHGRAPSRGHSGISINVNGGNNAEYDTLLDGVMSTFHHELFHNLQRCIALDFGGNTNLDGKDEAWQFFSEGIASFVPTVAQQDIQFEQSRDARAYIAKAVEFVGGKGFPGELNTSYKEMNPYNAAVYWRFLFEQCGGMQNSAVGMGVIRAAMQVLYSKQVVDITQTTDLVGSLSVIMDRTLSHPSASTCPFSSYQESLQHFSRAIYALGLEGGRCDGMGSNPGCGFYDPNQIYSSPMVRQHDYAGGELILDDENLASSYGMDFINIQLKKGAQGQSATIEFSVDEPEDAVFSVQVWLLKAVVGGALSGSNVEAVSETEVMMNHPGQGYQTYTLSEIDTSTVNRIALIITRLDPNESDGYSGSYAVRVAGK